MHQEFLPSRFSCLLSISQSHASHNKPPAPFSLFLTEPSHLNPVSSNSSSCEVRQKLAFGQCTKRLGCPRPVPLLSQVLSCALLKEWLEQVKWLTLCCLNAYLYLSSSNTITIIVFTCVSYDNK